MSLVGGGRLRVMNEHPGDYDPPKLFTVQRGAAIELAKRHIRMFGSEGKAWT